MRRGAGSRPGLRGASRRTGRGRNRPGSREAGIPRGAGLVLACFEDPSPSRPRSNVRPGSSARRKLKLFPISLDFRFSSWWYQKGASRGFSPSVQVNLSHCARFVFPLALSTKPTLPPMWQRLFPLAPATYGSKEECEYFETRPHCFCASSPWQFSWCSSSSFPVGP